MVIPGGLKNVIKFVNGSLSGMLFCMGIMQGHLYICVANKTLNSSHIRKVQHQCISVNSAPTICNREYKIFLMWL